MKIEITKAQLNIFRLLAMGKTSAEIAYELDKNAGYIRTATLMGRQRLNAKTNAQAVAMLVADGAI